MHLIPRLLLPAKAFNNLPCANLIVLRKRHTVCTFLAMLQPRFSNFKRLATPMWGRTNILLDHTWKLFQEAEQSSSSTAADWVKEIISFIIDFQPWKIPMSS